VTLCWSSSCYGVSLLSRLGAVFVRLNWQIRFDSVHIQRSMTLAPSTLQTRRHRYSEHFKFVIFVGFVTFVGILPLYAINVDAVSLFAVSSFSVFSDLELYCSMYSINLNEWMSFLVKQKKYNRNRYLVLDIIKIHFGNYIFKKAHINIFLFKNYFDQNNL
jgi:hypothetical protein